MPRLVGDTTAGAGSGGSAGPGFAVAARFCPDPPLQPALGRLCAILRDWAARRGSEWTTVLNAGPLLAGRAPHPFRWRILADALRLCAGRPDAQQPSLGDYGALPSGLQEALRWALGAALREPPPAADPLRAGLALAEAERLAETLGEASPPRPDGGPGRSSAAARGDGPETLLAALAASGAPRLPPAGAALLAALRDGPVSTAEVRGLAAAHGLLPASLLEALDAYAVMTVGVRATAVEAGSVSLAPDYMRAAAGPGGKAGTP